MEDLGAGYTFFWKGKPDGVLRTSGVGFAIRTSLALNLDELPRGISERIMVMRLKLSEKSICNDHYKEYDYVALNETWLSSSEENNRAVISSLILDGYNIIHAPRETRGEVVAFIHRKQFSEKN